MLERKAAFGDGGREKMKESVMIIATVMGVFFLGFRWGQFCAYAGINLVAIAVINFITMLFGG